MHTPTKDDIFAYALSKTLTKASSPATVGLYSSCQDRINMILEKMEVYMKDEASRIEEEHKEAPKPRSAQPSLTDFFSLIWKMIFYRPIWTKENQNQRNVRFIYVDFSAWHFVGSDMLWAGLAIRLFESLQYNFGKLQLAVYRVVQWDEEDDVKNKKVEDGPDQWRSKKICCFPLWLLVVVVPLVLLAILIFLLAFNFLNPKIPTDVEVDETKGGVNVLEGILIASLGVPAVSVLRFVFMTVKNLIFSQEENVKKGMDDERISKKLGFMNEVRKEIWLLSRFIEFMQVFERRRIRVVLRITNLDRCPPKKIVSVLEAINILLSDEDSPLISILAVNPEILVEKVNFADGCFSKEDRAFAMLDRIVTLAFTVPPLCDDSKHCLFHSMASNSKKPKDININKQKSGCCFKNSSSSDVEIALETKESLLGTPVTPDITEEEVEDLVNSILYRSDRMLHKYMSDDAMSMRRVINSIKVTSVIMKAMKKELPQPEHVAAWVVLANEWPCRLSWIVQCVEDAEQRAQIDSKAAVDGSKTLWKVFNESKAELYVMSAQIEDLLQLDGDPEMFENFLTVDFKFTINDLRTFEEATVNLDHSIRQELAQIRGTSRLKDSGWMRNLAPLPITTIINMDTEDICRELERMEYPTKYSDIVRSNNLNGSTLVFGDKDDLKDLLSMTFGEWTNFKLHFLGSPPHLQTLNRNTVPAAQSQKMRFRPNVCDYYSSNPNLVNSSR